MRESDGSDWERGSMREFDESDQKVFLHPSNDKGEVSNPVLILSLSPCDLVTFP